MKLNKKMQASVDRLQRRHPLVAARLELEGLKLAHEMKCAEVAELKRRIRLAREEALGQMVSTALWRLLDLRKPAPASRRGGK